MYLITIEKRNGLRYKTAYRNPIEGYATPSNSREADYACGWEQPNYPMPAIYKCYCGYTLEQHKDMKPCDNLGFLQY